MYSFGGRYFCQALTKGHIIKYYLNVYLIIDDYFYINILHLYQYNDILYSIWYIIQ